MNKVRVMVSKVYGSTKGPGKAKASSEWTMGLHSPVGDVTQILEKKYSSHLTLSWFWLIVPNFGKIRAVWPCDSVRRWVKGLH